MLRSPVASFHVAPASSERYRPPFGSFSISAYTRVPSAPDTLTPALPQRPDGSPGFFVISVHVLPPSVDLNSPLPGPPLDMPHGKRCDSHSVANSTAGLLGSSTTSAAP